MENVETKNGIILYTDAGSRPNPGYTGWGIHGYIYTLEESKKGTGLTDQVLTEDGYISKFILQDLISKNIAPSIVYPVKYIDGYGNFNFNTTNNVGELTAAIEGLLLAKTQNVISVKIITDSEYVVKGTNEFLEKWRVNGWTRQDNTQIANIDLWQTFNSILLELESLNIKVTIDWIKGHAGNFGNEISDRYATVGILKARKKEHVKIIELSDSEGYWKYKVDRHPFISHRRMFFNTLSNYQVPGHYYLGEHGKDDDLIGKKSSDGSFAYIVVDEPDHVLEMIKSYQSKIANYNDAFIMVRLDFIFNPTNHKELVKFEDCSLDQSNQYRLDLFGLNKEPVTRELRPAKLAIRAIETLSDISEKLDQFLAGDKRYIETNITESFFDITTSMKKKEEVIIYKLKPTIIVGATYIDIVANYESGGIVKSKNIRLSYGIDIPNRNSIKHMEELKPKIQLITWKESDKSFRFATVITTDKDKGIWCGSYSNLVIVSD